MSHLGPGMGVVMILGDRHWYLTFIIACNHMFVKSTGEWASMIHAGPVQIFECSC